MEASPSVPAVTRQKTLGAFYTPAPMAARMVEWAVRSPQDRVLDPSFGGLVFLETARARLRELGADGGQTPDQMFGCDLDHDAHAAAVAHERLRIPPHALLLGNFFETAPGADLPRVEAVVGNPPYIRYQLANGMGDRGRRAALALGVTLTRLASSWAPFALHASRFVAPGGRMALVLPAELLHAQYAHEVLDYLQRQFARITLVVFEERVFPGVLEEVVLLFAEGHGEGFCEHPNVLECRSLADLDVAVLRDLPSSEAPSAAPLGSVASVPRGRRRGRAKLISQLLASDVRELYERLERDDATQRLGRLASVDIGAVTGANDFFLVARDEEAAAAPELLRPAVSKALHVRGARFAGADFDGLLARGARCRLFVADNDSPQDQLSTVSDYLRRGQARGIHERFKCRVREPWWRVPLPRHGAPDLFLTYCSAEHPRLVFNEAKVLHTNTLHGVSMKDDDDPRALAAGFYNSLTLLSAELEGRSYGGGVLKLEPSEAEALVLPPLSPHLASRLDDIDAALRDRNLALVLDIIDPVVLNEGLGLSEGEVALLRSGAARLRARRRARGNAPARF